MEKTALLELKNIGVEVPSEGKPLTILKDISLAFEKGRSTAVTGPSGSGKTTLMMVCAGLQAPSAGKMFFQGEAVPFGNENSLTDWRRNNIGIVFQNFHLLPTNSAIENVMVPIELSGAANARSEAESLLNSVGLAHRLHHLPGQLSGGEQQRVALARALALRPALLLADEPTGNLDQATGNMVMDLLFSQAREFGTTLIMITHDQSIAQRCDRIVSLKDGSLSQMPEAAIHA